MVCGLFSTRWSSYAAQSSLSAFDDERCSRRCSIALGFPFFARRRRRYREIAAADWLRYLWQEYRLVSMVSIRMSASRRTFGGFLSPKESSSILCYRDCRSSFEEFSTKFHNRGTSRVPPRGFSCLVPEIRASHVRVIIFIELSSRLKKKKILPINLVDRAKGIYVSTCYYLLCYSLSRLSSRAVHSLRETRRRAKLLH